MRLWSFHPSYLDDESLLELWRDGLAAFRSLNRAALGVEDRLYSHPQLTRFKVQRIPADVLSAYLWIVDDVMKNKGIKERRRTALYPRIEGSYMGSITVTAGQMEREVWLHGARLVQGRGNGQAYYDFWSVPEHRPHPLFHIIPGAVEAWEKLPPYDYPKCENCGDPVSSDGRGKPRKYCEMCRPSRKRSAY